MAQSTKNCEPKGRLYCAGQDRSIDHRFYEWVMDGAGVEVIPLGGHRDVVRQVREAPESSPVPVTGVVDRDAWPEETLTRQGEHVEVLPFYEVESFLVHPGVLGRALELRGRGLGEDALIDMLLEAAKAIYMPAINAHLGNAPKARGRTRLQQMAAQYAEQLQKADAIIASRDANAILQYFPGRRLAQRVARQMDFLNALHLFDMILEAPGLQRTSPPIRALRRRLLQRLGLDADEVSVPHPPSS